ncbi:MAG TPA: hypothetical protein VFQ35_14715 [Polyangiaceae bacterium]|nr:hypothetical protein [Polyangiaceae bacterium]
MTSFCIRFSVGLLVGTALLHFALAARMGSTNALLLAAPGLVLAGMTWLMRIRWVLWVGLSVLVLLETCALVGYASSDASTRSVIVWAFAIALSSVQLPIGALVAAARYFESAE